MWPQGDLGEQQALVLPVPLGPRRPGEPRQGCQLTWAKKQGSDAAVWETSEDPTDPADLRLRGTPATALVQFCVLNFVLFCFVPNH